jgi:nucleotide-binding universal stress UspA family protein
MLAATRKGAIMERTVIVGVDGSEPSHRAVEWTSRYAAATHVRVVAIHAIDIPVYPPLTGLYLPSPGLTSEQQGSAHSTCLEYCKPLADAGVDYELVIAEGHAVAAMRDAAEERDAELVVVGRRGRGGFAELLLGSTSHDLAVHLGRPLVIIP